MWVASCGYGEMVSIPQSALQKYIIKEVNLTRKEAIDEQEKVIRFSWVGFHIRHDCFTYKS